VGDVDAGCALIINGLIALILSDVICFVRNSQFASGFDPGAFPSQMAASRAVNASEREAAKYRDTMAAKMTPAQIAEAQQMAREWLSPARQ
jgi:hypothetical protein